MNTIAMGGYLSGTSLTATFALAGAIALSAVTQALAGDTSVTLGNGDTATVQGGGTKVETDANGNVRVFVSGNGSVTVYTDSGIAVITDGTAALPKAGGKLADGTIYAGDNLSVTPADAPSLYNWESAKRYCVDLHANGHDDWVLPTYDQLDRLHSHKSNGAFAGTFNERGYAQSRWYWSSTEFPVQAPSAYVSQRRFDDGYQHWKHKGEIASVRCVRAEPHP